jgi:sec-independent protein translocase protein TatC
MRLMPRTRARKRRDAAQGMTVIEHLEELRSRVIVSLIAVVVGATIGWVFFHPIFDFMTKPYVRLCKDGVIHSPTHCKLVFTGVVEPFLIRFKVSLAAGLAIALPVLLYELWRFITPGLTRPERRLALPFVGSSLVLFALGGLFAYLTLSKGLRFLLGFAGDTIVPLLTVDRYINFVIFMVLAFGLSFEFPLVLIMLCWVRVLSSQKLIAWWRWAVLLIAVYAAVITPSQDPWTMAAMMVPMIAFYVLSILVARALKR